MANGSATSGRAACPNHHGGLGNRGNTVTFEYGLGLKYVQGADGNIAPDFDQVVGTKSFFPSDDNWNSKRRLRSEVFSYRDGMRDWFVLGKDDYKTVQNTRTGEVYQIPKDALNPFKDDIDLYNIQAEVGHVPARL